MKNVKLTLVTALSVLALTFAGVATAGNNSHHKKQNEVTYTKKVVVTKTVVKQARIQHRSATQLCNLKQLPKDGFWLPKSKALSWS
ncbi:hypothetical protein [Amphritea opalescens]|uniref:hypothetical protein n=1 Tax=Amphritea opalescens TaxID=2490544 RepID=UPI0013E05B80|nr:hypothetical protein [Amphritea opalescens]